jgi:ATP-binding cassette, subfamily C, bacterial CydC
LTTTLRRLLALTDVSRGRLALSVLLGALTVLFGVGLMATAGYLISRAAERPAILSLTVAIVLVRFFALSRPLFRYLERVVSHDLAFRVLGNARLVLYQRIEPLAPVQLEGYRKGDLLSRMVADVGTLQNLHLRAIGPPLVALVAGVVAIGAAAAVAPWGALVLAAGLLLGGIAVPAVAGSLTRRTGGRQAAARGTLTAELVDVLNAAPELAVYGREDGSLDRIRAADDELVRLARRDALAGGVGDALVLLVIGVTVAGVIACAISAHTAGDLDRTMIAMVALLALASFEAAQPLSAASRELFATLAAGRRLLELMGREPIVTDPTEPELLPPPPIVLALENVRVRYAPEEDPVLDGFSLRLEPGRRIALVGESGAGKTTVVNLVLRFLDPEHGSVTLGGRDLRKLSQADVRRAIAVAGQESHLFSTSIRENVLLGRPEASDAEFESALHRAGLEDLVRELPDGWDTLVGEQGKELSGGQRQRITLARALLADTPILVLDEPTAHLDSATAQRLLGDILEAADGRSVLLITHRPEGLDLVDEIVVLASGRAANDLGDRQPGAPDPSRALSSGSRHHIG